VSLKRHGKTDAALNELTQCLKLRPSDAEAQALQAAWKAPAVLPVSSSTGAGADPAATPDPLERIVRSFDATAFRQASVMVDQMNATRLAALGPRDRALKLSTDAKGYLDRGLLLEAERLYQSALAEDGSVAEAHLGLALVRERAGNADDARKEAHAALELTPSADAYLVLCRLDMAENRLSEARDDAGNALKLEPRSQTAHELLRQIESRSGESK
jgi:tetratricopeptide (TPR) repeat protein